MKYSPEFLILGILAFSAFACAFLFLLPAYAQSPASIVPIGKMIQIRAPLGLPPVPVPADNPLTEETIALGRRLYYDPALSVDGTISCASCHAPQFAFSDNRSVSEGVFAP
jgi:cytochrome c peroxidase